MVGKAWQPEREVTDHTVGSQDAQLTFSFIRSLLGLVPHIHVDTLIDILEALSPRRFRLTVKINSICWTSTIHSMIAKKHPLSASYRAWLRSARRINYYKPHLTVPKDQDLEQGMVSIVCHCSMTSGTSVGKIPTRKTPECSPDKWCLMSAETWPGAGHLAHFSMWPGFLTAGPRAPRVGIPRARANKTCTFHKQALDFAGNDSAIPV